MPRRVESRSADLLQQLHGQLGSESIECFIKGQAFSRSYDLAPRPPLPPSLSHQQAHRNSEKERQAADGVAGEGGGRGAESRTPGPLLIMQKVCDISAVFYPVFYHRRRDVMTTLQVRSFLCQSYHFLGSKFLNLQGLFSKENKLKIKNCIINC